VTPGLGRGSGGEVIAPLRQGALPGRAARARRMCV